MPAPAVRSQGLEPCAQRPAPCAQRREPCAPGKKPRRRCPRAPQPGQKASPSVPGASPPVLPTLDREAESPGVDASELRRRGKKPCRRCPGASPPVLSSLDRGAEVASDNARQLRRRSRTFRRRRLGRCGQGGAARHRCAGLVIGAAAWMERLQPWQGPPCAERRRGPVPPQRALPPRCGYHGLRTAIIHIGAATPYIPA